MSRYLSVSKTIVLSLTLFLCACSSVIDLDSEMDIQRLVIDGRITNGSFGNEVRLAFTSTFNGNQEPISGATITLLEEGAALAQYLETEPGLYILELANHSATAGTTYELEVELVDGTQYRSSPGVMPDNAAMDNPRFEVGIFEEPVNQEGTTVDRRLVKLFTDTEVLDPSEDYYLRWEVYETYIFEERQRTVGPFEPIPQPCYITNRVTGRDPVLFNGAELKVPVIPDVELASIEIDSRFIFNYLFNLVQFTTDLGTHTYRANIDGVANAEGSIFDVPPGPVLGNFRNLNDPDERVLGYFEVVRTDTTWVKVVRDDIPFNVELPCPRANAFSEEPYCTNCLLLDNSTTVQPYYWF